MDWKEFYNCSARTYGNVPKTSGWWNNNYFRAVQDAVLTVMGENAATVIIDIGCGPGLLLKPVVPPKKVIGLDYSVEMLRLARGNYAHPVLADCQAIPFRSASCNMVLCAGVLQTLQNPVPVIDELIRITHPRGSVIVVTHNSHSIIRKFAPRKGFARLPQKHAIETAFQAHGFTARTLLGLHYPSLRIREINNFNWVHRFFCTSLIWKFTHRNTNT